MQTHDAKRVVIMIEKIMLSRLTDAIEKADVSGYSICLWRIWSLWHLDTRKQHWARRWHGAGCLHHRA